MSVIERDGVFADAAVNTSERGIDRAVVVFLNVVGFTLGLWGFALSGFQN